MPFALGAASLAGHVDSNPEGRTRPASSLNRDPETDGNKGGMVVMRITLGNQHEKINPASRINGRCQ